MKKTNTRVFTAIFACFSILVYPSIGTALSFGLNHIAGQFANMTWSSPDNLSGTSAGSGIEASSSDTGWHGGSSHSNFQAGNEEFGDNTSGSDLDDPGRLIYAEEGSNQEPCAPVPEPATLLLMSAGLIGLAAARKK